jgi:hypothetical protein
MGSLQPPELNPSLTPSLDIEQHVPEKPTLTSGTPKAGGTGNTIAPSPYITMVLEPVSIWYDVLSNVFMWIILAGFLVLPSTFPNLEKIVDDLHVFNTNQQNNNRIWLLRLRRNRLVCSLDQIIAQLPLTS